MMTASATLMPQWVIWNGSAGLLAMAETGRVEPHPHGRTAWLAHPFDMVGPFNLDELEARGRIEFAACIVMSRQRWQDDQAQLRQTAYAQRKAAQERMHAQQEHPHERRRRGLRPMSAEVERGHRALLELPTEGPLTAKQIKSAFRRLAQKAHPDQGGEHGLFIRISDARRALMDRHS